MAVLERFPEKDQFLDELRARIIQTEIKHHGCAQVIVQTFLDIFGIENRALLMAASPFFAGIALTGQTCGALIGSLMVLGMAFGRQDLDEGLEGLIKGVRPMRRLVKTFGKENEHFTCKGITGVDLSDSKQAEEYFGTGGLERCANMMADVSVLVGDLLYTEYQARKAA